MKPLNFFVSVYWVISFLLAGMLPQTAMAIDWPQELSVPEGVISVYQPQPESLVGNVLKGRAAMSFKLKESKDPVFGAFWFTGRIDTDQDKKLVTIRDIKVTKVGWPDSKAAGESRFTEIVNRELAAATFQISTSRLSASLATTQREAASLKNLKNDPPKIIFSDSLAVLLPFDGQPKFSAIEKSSYERAINTPFAVARHKTTKKAYLSNGTYWYVADNVLGPWTVTPNPPADLLKLMPKSETKEAATAKPPRIVVATEPTELISTNGKPNWQSLLGGKIMYVKNTETPWLRELTTNKMYVQLSGRWFASASEAGPWQFVRPDQLPASFKDIPPGSEIGGVRVSVAGTEEAEDAMLEAQIPQTAAISRSKAKFSAVYDGKPKFEAIPGTKVSYAVNTSSQVLLINNVYYAVDNGVWFTSKAATGPWVVADEIPKEEISKIPPSSPVYNTTYVQIYESTPETVYVGYTPGYMWSFPYYGVPYYGTGYAYPAYYGSSYYPRPPTWGLNVGYNPWSGWNFGLSWSNGFFSIGIGWNMGGGYYGPAHCCGGYYGGGYRPAPTFVNTGDINIGNSAYGSNRTSARGSNRQTVDRRQSSARNNVYDRPENRARNSDARAPNRSTNVAKPNPKARNNVYVDQQGNVARKQNGQWETRDNGEWRSERSYEGAGNARNRDSGAAQRRSSSYNSRSSSRQFDRGGFDRAQSARNHGRAMEQRGGGGRRR